MSLADWTIGAGFLICLAGAVLTIRQVGRRLWWAREQPRQRSAKYVEGIADVTSQAVLWGGMTMTQFGNIAGHINDKTPLANPWLSPISGAAVLLVFGVQLGRLLMRWQVQRLLADLDMASGEIPPRL
jgi:hypothetical protein